MARLAGGPAQTHFLVDGAGCVVLELYDNPSAPQPDYGAMDPLLLHVASFGLAIQLAHRATPLVG